MPPVLQSLSNLSDSDEKAVLLVEAYYTNRQSHPDISSWCQQLLRGVPSPRAVELLQQHLNTNNMPDNVCLEMVQLIGESRTEVSVSVLTTIVTSEKRLTPISSSACMHLAKWAFQKDVLNILENRLLLPDSEKIQDVIGILWGVEGGRDAIAKIATGSASSNLRSRALRELAFHIYDTEVVTILWKIAEDESTPEELRITALNSLRGVSRVLTAKQKMLLEKWTKDIHPLGKTAQELKSSAAISNTRDIQRFIRARDYFQHSRNVLAAKKEKLTPDEQASLRHFDLKINAIDIALKKMDPERELCAKLGPTREFTETQDAFIKMSRLKEESLMLSRHSDTDERLKCVEKRLNILKHRLDELDPTGQWRRNYVGQTDATPGRSERPKPISSSQMENDRD